MQLSHAAGQGPFLFFTKVDVPSLQRKIEKPDYAPIWQAIESDAQRLCDFHSPDYADPALYEKTLETGKFAGMVYARQLSFWMETLGFAYQMTGARRYGEHGAAVLERAAHHVTRHSGPMQNQFDGSYGDMMRALAVGLDFFSEAMTPEQRATVVATARGYAEQQVVDYHNPDGFWQTQGMAKYHNFSGVCGGAFGLLAIALRHDCPAEVPGWLDLAERMILAWFEHAFDPEGAYSEGVLYLEYGMGTVAMLGEALQRYLGRSAILDHRTFRNLPIYLATQRLPGSPDFDARNDSLYSINLGGGGSGICSPWPLLLASGCNGRTKPDPLAAWVWKTASPKKPQFLQIVWGIDAAAEEPAQIFAKPFGTFFAQQGMAVWRTGWDRDDAMFSIEAGIYRHLRHDQGDKGHFNFYALGHRWAVDTGYGNNREPGGRCQTEAHSCVLVDGKGQALTGAGLGTDGQVVRYENTARHGYALVDAKSAYQQNTEGTVGVPLTRALRHAFFLRPVGVVPAYAVILDDIAWDNAPHEFTWQLIGWKEMTIEVRENRFVVRPGSGPADPCLQVILHAAAPLALSNEPFTPDQHVGRPPYDYWRMRARGTAVNPRFVALLAPLPPGTAGPSLVVEEADGGRRVKIDWGSRIDTIVWTGDEAKLH